MSDHYQVKFVRNGKTHFGIADCYSPEAKKYAKKGQIVVDDACLPVRYAVNESDIVDLPHGPFGRWNPQTNEFEPDPSNEYDCYVHAEEKKAIAADKAAGKGVAVGKMFTTHVGDGCAYYVVTAVTARTCKIEWRSYQGDRYVDMHFGYGGSFPKSQIARYIRMEQADAEMFGGR